MGNSEKRYYFLRFTYDFWEQLHIKKMRKSQNGERVLIIYTKLLTYSCVEDGKIYSQGVFDTIEEEIAEAINESIEDIEAAFQYFRTNKLIFENEECITIYEASEMLSSEAGSTRRVRRYRARVKASENNSSLSCNDNVTHEKQSCNSDEAIEYRDKSIENRDKSIESREEAETHTHDSNSNSDQEEQEGRHAYGEYAHVKLSGTEYSELINEFSFDVIQEYIRRVDSHCEQKGKTYNNYKVTIQKWIKEDREKAQNKGGIVPGASNNIKNKRDVIDSL